MATVFSIRASAEPIARQKFVSNNRDTHNLSFGRFRKRNTPSMMLAVGFQQDWSA
jgi:hypothetical protein